MQSLTLQYPGGDAIGLLPRIIINREKWCPELASIADWALGSIGFSRIYSGCLSSIQKALSQFLRAEVFIDSIQTMRSTVRISLLLWADILVGYALFELQDYLTEIWGLSFTHAAGILNVWNGISLVLQPLFLFFVGTFLRNFGMLVISSSSYTLGIWFLFMSAPPVLANATGTCKQYKKECIGEAQKVLFYIGMAFIAVGVAGNNVSVRSFLKEQPETTSEHWKTFWRVGGMLMVVVVAVAGAIALPYIKPWHYRFGIPAVCTTIAWLAFFTGLCRCCQYDRPEGHYSRNYFGMLTFRMWLTFLVCGMVSSTGNTYFVEQAKHLDRHLGVWEVPTQVLLLAQTQLGHLLAGLASFFFAKGKGIGVAKMFAVLCCVAAALTEKKRLGVVRGKGLLDSPDADVPMSVYWLLFQFVLLGGMEILMEKSVDDFYEGTAPVDPDERRLEVFPLEIFSKGVAGIGYMCGVLCVYVVGRVTKEGGDPGWFTFDLNRSRLDRYYWVLAVLSSGSLVVFVLVRMCRRC